jgi:hypothetical protein
VLKFIFQEKDDLAIPFRYKLTKPLQFGTIIRIEFGIIGSGQIAINLMHDVPHENPKKSE